MNPADRLLTRLAEARESPEAPPPDAPLVVAVSGGLDSCALLHALRFGPSPDARWGARLFVAHFDHGMREGSALDAQWLRGLSSAWGLEFVTAVADVPPTSEAEARAARYDFLQEVRRGVGAAAIATAHHADDQAETVLFRMLRGTGPGGLRGIRAGREDGVWRPFLAAWREELLAYARAVGLGWREDPTNVELGFARNAIRHRLIPDAEKWVAPGARRALVRFSERAAFDEEGWDSLMPGLLTSSGLERTDAGVTVERAALAALHPAVRARVLRAVAAGLGFRLGAERTSRAVAFVTEAGSGRRIDLGGGLVLRRDLDRLSIHRAEGVLRPDRTVVIAGPEAGRDHATLGGRRVRVGWGAVDVGPSAAIERFACAQLRFPLSVRAWADGDRIRMDAGSRKLKQLFLEARVPVEERRAVPVLTDREGEVLWVPGVARSRTARVRPGMPEGSLLPVWFA